MTTENSIKEAMKAKKLLIGAKSVAKAMKTGKLSQVIFASNCPEDKVKDISHYSKTGGVKVEGMKENSLRLGEICGKPFNVLMVGIKK